MRSRARLGATLVVLGLMVAAGLEFGRLAWGTGDWIGRFSQAWAWSFGAFALACAILTLVALLALWRPTAAVSMLQAIGPRLAPVSFLRWPVVATLVALPAFLIYFTSLGSILTGPYVRAILLGMCIAAALPVGGLTSGKAWRTVAAISLAAGVALVVGRALVGVSSYPFSLSWSEGNRWWDYSLAFGRDRYLYPADGDIFAYISPGRQALWGLVFLIPNATIWMARLWDAVLFTLPYALLGWFAAGIAGARLPAAWRYAFAAWTLLFLAQGPVYTPLVLSAILVALAVRSRSVWIAGLLVALASYYAYDSRWTWFVAPATWAMLITLLQGSVRTADRWDTQRLWRVLGLGLAGLLGGYLVPTGVAWLVGGAGPSAVAGLGGALSSQPLLWYRWLPNPTYGPGVLLALLLVAGPVLGLLFWLRKARNWSLDGWQRLALAGVLLGFLAVGLVVSVKIGGGSNLHNLDMFLITLVLSAAVALGPLVESVRGEIAGTGRTWLILAIAIPAALTITSGGPLRLPDPEVTQAALQVIRGEVAEALPRGEVLFYDQRQLLTFGSIEGVPLVPDYEKKYMADKGLSGDPEFYAPFYRDLAAHRFSLIVSPPLELTWQEDHPFSEEDEVQVVFIYRPMDEYYEPIVKLDAIGVWLLAPRDSAASQGEP